MLFFGDVAERYDSDMSKLVKVNRQCKSCFANHNRKGCRALAWPDYEDGQCPFFKTREQHIKDVLYWENLAKARGKMTANGIYYKRARMQENKEILEDAE